MCCHPQPLHSLVSVIIAVLSGGRVGNSDNPHMLLLSSFSFRLQVIKARIHGLIEREYLERDPTQTNHYNYLA